MKITTRTTTIKALRWGATGSLILAAAALMAISSQPGAAADSDKDQTAPAAVEDDMHEFMEYVFEPPYKRLKASLATASTDRAIWKGIKSDSLILAEAANLLLHRHPAEHADSWNKNALAVRQQGSQLYQAAKKRDVDASKVQFAALLKKCNQCHDQFADGKHQLAP